MPLFRDGENPELRRWSEPAQIAGFTACALFINFLIGYLLSLIGFSHHENVPADLIKDFGILFAFLLSSFIAPFYETVIGQWLPMVVARWAKKSPPIQLLYASIWFGILHIRNGPAYVVQTVFIGWVLAASFLFCQKENWLKAYRVTTLVHILHNFVIFVLFLTYRAILRFSV